MARSLPQSRVGILLMSGLVGISAVGIGYTTISRPNVNKVHPHPLLQPVVNYISRPDLERKLCDQLLSRKCEKADRDETRSRIVVVSGPSGVGKSQLVLNFAQTQGHHYHAVFWIEARRDSTIVRDYVQIYRTRMNRMPKGDMSKIGIHDAINTVEFWLGQQEKRCLWVMDNLNDISCSSRTSDVDLRFYLPASLNIDCIITTRDSSGIENADAEVVVAGMSEDEATRLFKKQTGLQEVSPEAERDICTVVKELEYLPLAVALAGSCVAKDPLMACEPQKYLHHYRAHYNRQSEYNKLQYCQQYRKSTLCALQVSLSAIARQSPIASRIFELLAFLDFDDVLPDLFESSEALNFSLEPQIPSENALWRKSLSLPEGRFDGQAIKSAFDLFTSYSLAFQLPGHTTYTMNEMAYTWIRQTLNVSQKQKWSPVALKLFEQVSKAGQYNMDVAVRLIPHVLVAFDTYQNTLGHKRPVTEIEQASLVTAQGLLSLSGCHSSERIDNFIYSVTEEAFGPEDARTLQTMFMLGAAKFGRHHYNEAEDLYRETLETRRRVLGAEHEDTIRTMVFLAISLTYQHKHEAAEELHKAALELMRAHAVPDKSVLFDCMSHLCFALCDGKKYEAAKEMNATILSLKEEYWGPGHPEVIRSMHDKVIITNMQGQYVQAEAMAREVLSLQRQVLGLHHPDMLRSLKLLGCTLANQSIHERQGDEYSDLYLQGLCIFGPEHPELLRRTAYEFSGLKWKKEYEYAEILGRSLLRELEELIRPADRLTLLVKAYLADILRRQGKYAAAERLVKEAFNTSKRQFGLEDTITQESLHRLGSILYEQGKYKEGEEASRLDYEVMERVKGPESVHTLMSMGCLAETLEAGEKFEEALSLFRRIRGPLEECKGPDHPTTVQAYRAELRIREKLALAKRGEKRRDPGLEVDEEK